MMMVMAMEMIKCSGLEKKKEKNKKAQGKCIFDRIFLFWHSRHQVGVSVFSTTRNIHFYDENLNDESKTVIEDRFL